VDENEEDEFDELNELDELEEECIPQNYSFTLSPSQDDEQSSLIIRWLTEVISYYSPTFFLIHCLDKLL
jgi:hypothetical protein